MIARCRFGSLIGDVRLPSPPLDICSVAKDLFTELPSLLYPFLPPLPLSTSSDATQTEVVEHEWSSLDSPGDGRIGNCVSPESTIAVSPSNDNSRFVAPLASCKPVAVTECKLLLMSPTILEPDGISSGTKRPTGET